MQVRLDLCIWILKLVNTLSGVLTAPWPFVTNINVLNNLFKSLCRMVLGGVEKVEHVFSAYKPTAFNCYNTTLCMISSCLELSGAAMDVI